MDSWINEALLNEQASVMILLAILFMGMLSVFTCACNFAIIGVVAGYSGASPTNPKRGMLIWKALAFLLGTVVAMSAIGALFGFAGDLISDSMGRYWKIAAGLVSIIFGLYTMDLVPFKIPGITLNPAASRQTLFTAILFGFVVGGLSSACNTCCNPFFPVILAASFVKGSMLWGFLMLTTFALGFGLPLSAMIIGVSVGVGTVSKTLSKVVTVVKYIGGIALLVLGFYLLATF
jgi:cytochrome c biogenesis protein CcdA